MKVQQLILAASIALLSMSCEDEAPVTHDHILVPEVETPVLDSIVVPVVKVGDSLDINDSIISQ